MYGTKETDPGRMDIKQSTTITSFINIDVHLSF